jgi:hypothetical protein
MTAPGQPSADATVGDMNGALAYWGPVRRAATIAPAPPIESNSTHVAALRRLGETLHGRTWSGTSRLMGALFADAHPSL